MASLELQQRQGWSRDREAGDLVRGAPTCDRSTGGSQAAGQQTRSRCVTRVPSPLPFLAQGPPEELDGERIEPGGSQFGELAGAQPPQAPLPPPELGSTLCLAAWLALLFAGYGMQRGLCAAGLPYDCDSPAAADVFNGLTLLAFFGGGLGWLVGVASPARFAWLAAPRRAYLWAAYAALLPAYSALSNIPALQASLASTSVSPAFVAVNAAGEAPGCQRVPGSLAGTRRGTCRSSHPARPLLPHVPQSAP